MVEVAFPADVKNTCRRTVYGISCSKHLGQDLMAVMIYRKPEIDLEHVAARNARHRTPFTASRPPSPIRLDQGATLASLALQSRPANHCPCSAASGCRPIQISTGIDSSSRSTDIKPLCSRQYPPAYEVAHSTPHRDVLKNF